MPPKSQASELQDLRKDIALLQLSIAPPLAVLTDQVKELKVASNEIVAELRQKASKTEVGAIKVTVDMELGRIRQDLEVSSGNNANRIDNHDERLRDIETSQAQIKGVLEGLTKTVNGMEAQLSWLVGKIWWIIGVGGGGFGVLEFVLHKASK